MRIAIDARESGTSTGRYVDKLVEYLHKSPPQHDFVILTKTKRVAYMKDIAPKFKVVASDYKEFTFSEQLGLLHQLNKLKPDLVHFGMTQQPVLYKGKAVTTIHDLTTIRFDNPAKNRVIYRTKQQVYRRVIKRVATKSQYILTGSEFVKDDIAKFTGVNPDNIFVTHEAADKITEQPQAVTRLVGKKYIMYVGRPTPHKNLRRLIQAYELLRKAYPELMLVFAGKIDANYHQLEALVSEKRLASEIVFTDFVTEGELRWLYENTAAYVFPSLSEGFGLPGLEAMAHGAPVVSSNATCLPEIYGLAAEYFNPSNTREMAKAIAKVIGNSRRAGQLQLLGSAQVRKYSWAKMAQQTLDIYNRSLS